MAVVGTPSYAYGFFLDNASVLVEAFERCGKRPAELDRHMLLSGRTTLNLTLIHWANLGVNLWKVQGPATIQLIEGKATYQTVPNCISVLDMYYTQVNGGGVGVNTDRIMLPISRTEYAEYPNKLAQGTPTVFWFQKDTPIPQVTIYQAPQFSAPNYLLNYYWLSRIMDANVGSGESPDVDYLFYEALCADLAVQLSRKPTLVGALPKDLKDDLRARAAEAWTAAAATNREDSPMTIAPDLGGYWRR